jgi:hypothetical protein
MQPFDSIVVSMKTNSKNPPLQTNDGSEVNIAQMRARVWILLAVDACDRAGLLPIGKTRFHRIIFLSNCLAELYQATPPAKRVLKYKRGPFYPDVQWQLDRLTAMSLVKITNLTITEDRYGPWMDADYLITKDGIATAATIRRTPLGNATGSYIDELVFAFARLDTRSLDQLALSELNYAASGIAEGALITFEDANSNLALRKAADFQRVAPEALTNRIREQVQLYLRYLEKQEAACRR